jgi:hypothetical protein
LGQRHARQQPCKHLSLQLADSEVLLFFDHGSEIITLFKQAIPGQGSMSAGSPIAKNDNTLTVR